jgi:Group 4 capsule polysaccharide lipoprotein gfcB, YjbF
MGSILAMIAMTCRLIVLALLLAGCGSDRPAAGGMQQVRGLVNGLVQLGRRPAATPPAIVTRAAVLALGAPQISITIPARNGFAYMGQLGVTGPVVNWQTADHISLALRDGILVQTRGLGDDLMSADVPTPTTLQQQGQTFTRAYYHLDGSDRTLQRNFTCTSANVGAAQIEVLEQVYDTKYITETCTNGGATLTNEYWFEADQTLRRSIQWISPGVGAVQIDLLTDGSEGHG